MAKWPAFTPTRYPEIGVSQTEANQWRFVTIDEREYPHAVGDFYKTSAEIWADVDGYYARAWAGSDVPKCQHCGI